MAASMNTDISSARVRAAMAASMNTDISAAAAAVVEEETRPLLGVGSHEPGAAVRRAARIRPAPPPRRTFWRSCCEWLQVALARRKDPFDGIPVNKPLDANQLKRARELRSRKTWLEHFDLLAIHRHLAMECLSYYNSMHPCDEYEPAPGLLFKYIKWYDGFSLAHGNFVARRKRSGCFSLLPAPRTLFFFELVRKDGFDHIVTCTPLLEV